MDAGTGDMRRLELRDPYLPAERNRQGRTASSADGVTVTLREPCGLPCRREPAIPVAASTRAPTAKQAGVRAQNADQARTRKAGG